MKYFDELTMIEFDDYMKKTTPPVVVVPIGAVEEHGAHLPLGTDTFQPLYVIEKLAERMDILVAPPVYYGLCNSTRNFPGTISIRFETLYNLVLDILKELVRHGAKRIVVLSGHAGRPHMAALKEAAQDVVRAEPELKLMVLSDYDIVYELCGQEFEPDDGHAGDIETSRIMAIRPELVKGSGERSKPEFPPFRILAHPEKYFPSGIMGDPSAANAQKGIKLNDYVVDQLERLLSDF
ncbi:MAG: creatininase family protein [Thermoplasmata archaeon]|nr:MAG: creatininase family protein [Thermoplasmata archaeon]